MQTTKKIFTLEELKQQNKELNDLVLELEKKIRGHLRWWFLLPLFGFVVYSILIDKKRRNPEMSDALTKIKVEILKNEIEIARINKAKN
ncbi:hypothetical protein [Williamsoniiplasma lucivorax]|uniref:Uncharacterized protein n=1 Tax=Williamsoniiplasma lucivorax TaxID=209274 RepID=A0A2S5RD75_9MOLU|nr:hypothetical protein [Williamsoniiplasma lucivorax]PPE05162.1 hypothetical protein ELUCI_v1c06980 [Williamsoniiplasma lucivorax]